MGIFYDTVPCLNRTPVDLTVTFDGQSKRLLAGKVTHVPAVAIQYAKNQNPVMGSGDPHNPHITGARYLVADLSMPETRDNEHALMTEAEWTEHLGRPCRDDERIAFEDKYGNDPKARQIVQGKGRTVAANSRYDAVGSPKAGVASFEKRD